MQYRQLGNSGLNASVVAFGAWAIGGWKWGGTDANASVAAVRAAVDAGVNFIDTAAVYGFGVSEELVAKAIEPLDRQSLIIATKCGLRWDIETPTMHVESEGKRVFRCTTAESIAWELEQSLQRLNTDYIDLYQTHWPNPDTSPQEEMDALLSLKKAGKIRAIGFCNAPVENLRAARAVGELDVDQEKYSLLDREKAADNLPFCQSNNMAFLAYSPMAQGLLSGRVSAQRQFAEGDLRNDNPRFSQASRQAVLDLLAPVKALSLELNASVEQIVLAWTLQQPGLTHVLVGARNAEQGINNAKAGELVLSAESFKIVEKAAQSFAGFSA